MCPTQYNRRYGEEVVEVEEIHPLFEHDYYTLKQKIISLGRRFYIEDRLGNRIGYVEGTYIRLKDEFKIYDDTERSNLLLRIKQTQIIDAWGKFEVKSGSTGATVGYIKREFMRSYFISDIWTLMDANENIIGYMSEKSRGYGFMRRLFPFLPMRFDIIMQGLKMVDLKRKFITLGTWWVDCCCDSERTLDRRMVLSAVILLEAIEKAHESSRKR